jgi:hypothetical protein
VVPGSDVVGATVTFGVAGNLKGAASGPTLCVGSLTIRKLDNGKISTWVLGTDTTAAWDRIGAIQVQMTAVNGKDTVTYLRQIPVVNNDGTN